MTYLFIFLHCIALPGAAIAALVEGLYAIAAIDGAVFAMLFIIWRLFRPHNES